jgi:hypothetical protein
MCMPRRNAALETSACMRAHACCATMLRSASDMMEGMGNPRSHKKHFAAQG